MDTKLKKSKMVIGLFTWYAGLAIIIVNIALLIPEASFYSDFGSQIKTVMDGNYQNTEEFKYDISDYVNRLLAMAIAENTDAKVAYPNKNAYLGENTNNTELETSINIAPGSEEAASVEYDVTEEISEWDIQVDSDTSFSTSVNDYYKNNMTKEEADRYHDSMKSDRNILYTVSNRGKIVYTNEDTLGLYADGFVMPEGYNFMLYFDGEKALVIQDGKEIDIYGDEYFNDSESNSNWNIPGYKNFPADDMIKDVRLCIVAVQTPFMTITRNNTGGYHYNTRFYEIQQYLYQENAVYTKWLHMMAAGSVLLVLGLFLRKERKEAACVIAKATGKWWYEVKVIPALAILYFVFLYLIIAGNMMYWNATNIASELLETVYKYKYEYGSNGNPVFLFIYITIGFGVLWLFINDARYNKKPWKNSLTGKLIRLFNVSMLKLSFGKRMMRYQRRSFIICSVGAVLVIVWGTLYYEGVFNYLFDSNSLAFIIGGVLLYALFIGSQLIYAKIVRTMAEDVDLLAEQIKAVHAGEMKEQMELSGISEQSGLAQIGEELKDIKEGMNQALNEQMKSERMKVELIANVSHDIKTPLTSIISYVELLKQEEELPLHVKEYVAILENKSQRLKTMVQDVFEVSKAASGELPVKMEQLDLGKLLRQTLADMAEQIENSSVSVRPEIPEEAVIICADGDRLYRVFQNLIQNALQYSLDGSRVYVSLKKEGSFAAASVKNISREELQEDIDFTERFTRGDSSRSDGGSGLGLSIARSFTEACGGSFTVDMNADLFVVTVSFSSVWDALI